MVYTAIRSPPSAAKKVGAMEGNTKFKIQAAEKGVGLKFFVNHKADFIAQVFPTPSVHMKELEF
ncbi:hypothetical protein B0I75DRAFT_86165 [Yarrowia lipolytica]|nr:hypothetical protein B0I74DRAFT_86666 [Yarrowia lipolytica]RDW51344.1 hypothetical protein B0I75DRAFT_86165 [Yarrowia lipolytica]